MPEGITEEDIPEIIHFYCKKRYPGFSVTRPQSSTVKLYNPVSVFMRSYDGNKYFREGIFSFKVHQNKLRIQLVHTNIWNSMLIGAGLLLFIVGILMLSWSQQNFIIPLILGGILFFNGIFLTLITWGTCSSVMEDAIKAVRIAQPYMMEEIKEMNRAS